MLTAEQSAAAYSDAHDVVLVAGAGAGKTSTFAEALVCSVRLEPDRPVLAVTFPRAAAREMAARARRIAGLGPASPLNPDGPEPWIGTLHAWAWERVELNPTAFGRMPGVSLWDDGDVDDAVRMIARSIGEKALKVKDIDKARLSTLMAREQVAAELPRLLVEANALTFDGLELAVVAGLRRLAALDEGGVPAYQRVMVDEAQDLSPAQATLLDLLPGRRFRVGDPRQAIYGFRGSDPTIMLGWLPSWTAMHLTANFRSLGAVVGAANALAAAMGQDWRPMVAAREGEGVVRAYRAPLPGLTTLQIALDAHAAGRAWRDIYVIAPAWAEAEEARAALEGAGVPVVFGRPVNPWAEPAGRFVRRVLACLNNPADDVLWSLVASAMGGREDLGALRAKARSERRRLSELLAEQHAWARVLTTQRHLRAKTAATVLRSVLAAGAGPDVRHLLPVLEQWSAADALRELALYQKIEEPAETPDAVRIGTIHGAKGLEAPVVVMLGATASRFPVEGPDAAEGLRLLYVAVTRAADELHIVAPVASQGFSGLEPEVPTAWLHTMGLTLEDAPVAVWGAHAR
jgi:superfamily I DNA/RNA helicase